MTQTQYQNLVTMIEGLAKRLDGHDKHFVSIDERFNKIDKRFEQIDKRFEQIDKRFEQIDKRFGLVFSELGDLRRMMYQMDRNLSARIDKNREAIEQNTTKVDTALRFLEDHDRRIKRLEEKVGV